MHSWTGQMTEEDYCEWNHGTILENHQACFARTQLIGFAK